MAEILFYAHGARGERIALNNASTIYMDACFILGYLNNNDYCIELLEQAIDKNCELYISNTVYSEVVNVVLKTSIVLDGYYYKTNKNERIISAGAARTVARELTERDLQNIRRGFTRTLNVDNVVKAYLETKEGQNDFRSYFAEAVDMVVNFIKEFDVRFIEQDKETFDFCNEAMVVNLLSPFDAQHYACYLLGPIKEGVRKGPLDYLFTLDGDFERVTVEGKIIKIVS